MERLRRYEPGLGIERLEMAVPGKRHEQVGNAEQGSGLEPDGHGQLRGKPLKNAGGFRWPEGDARCYWQASIVCK